MAGRGPWWWVEEEDWLMAQVFHTHFTRAEARYRVCGGEITTVKQGYKGTNYHKFTLTEKSLLFPFDKLNKHI